MTHDDRMMRETNLIVPMADCPPLPLLRQWHTTGSAPAHLENCPRCRRTWQFLDRRAQEAKPRRALVIAAEGSGQLAQARLRRQLRDRVGDVLVHSSPTAWQLAQEPEVIQIVTEAEQAAERVREVRSRWPGIRPLVELPDDAPEAAIAAFSAGAFDVIVGKSFAERRRLGESALAWLDGETAPVEPLFGRLLPSRPTTWNWLSDAPPGRPSLGPREALTETLAARGIGTVELREVQTWSLGPRLDGLEQVATTGACWCAMLPAARAEAGELAARLERLNSGGMGPGAPVLYVVPPGFHALGLPAQRTFCVSTAVGLAALIWHLFPGPVSRTENRP